MKIRSWQTLLLLAIPLAIIFPGTSFSQGVAINEKSTPPNTSAILDVSSSNKGMLIPRMSAAARVAISTPATGLMVFDTTNNSFWFYAGNWQEVPKSGGGGPNGSAGGDLNGNYPSPQVTGLMGKTIEPAMPAHLQVLKWNNSSQHWQFNNDSLFLPYSASQSSSVPLFTITNTSAGFSAPAILGRHLAGSGIIAGLTGIWGDHTTGSGLTGTSNAGNGVLGMSNAGHGVSGQAQSNGKAGVFGRQAGNGSGVLPAFSMGVWGDNDAGAGVVGTSRAGIGLYGLSKENHGIYGYATADSFAGVYATHANNGSAIEGEIVGSGRAVFGKSTGTDGSAGLFQNINPLNTVAGLQAFNAGLAPAARFYTTNQASASPAVKIESNGNTAALVSEHSGSGVSNAAVLAQHNGPGIGIHATTVSGTAGKFENIHVANTNPAIFATTSGTGNVLDISSTNAGNTAPAVNILTAGAGTGLNIAVKSGKAAELSVTDATSLNDAFIVNNAGNGIAAVINAGKTASLSTGLQVSQPGLGRGINVSQTNAASNMAGINVTGAGQRGITVDVQGQFGIYSFAAANSGIGLWGRANGLSGVGVKGETGLGSVQNGIGVLGQSGSNDNGGIGVKGINYSSNETHGAVTGINMNDGVGVYGESNGLNGIAVLGVAGQGGFNSRGAQFKNINATNTKNVVEITNVGNGTNLYLSNTKSINSSPLVRGVYYGTGNFLTLENNLGVVRTTISGSGNIVTDGTLTVKENKGIVRSSTASQLRLETFDATFTPAGQYLTLVPHQFTELSLTFSTSFSAAPAVYVANILVNGNATSMSTYVNNVTTNGCKLMIMNNSKDNVLLYPSKWKIVAIGAE